MGLPPTGDTIAAIATAPGQGAIGIVRVAGPASMAIADALFVPRTGRRPSQRPAGRILVGRLVDAGEVIDDGVLLPFRAPNSYTGQDAVEFQVHGGPAVLRRVLSACLAFGARQAGPGEFTLRAHLAGKLSLPQAENVLAIVNASSERARRTAAAGLTERLTRELHELQNQVTAALGDVTALLDYPDEGVDRRDVEPTLVAARARIAKLLSTAAASAITQRGARLALVGRPNAGKSSLLNALLGYDRSIVSDAPGTTRDYLEAPIELAGVPVTAIDTAGIRTTSDAIEAAGVARALDLADQADVVVCLLDRSLPLEASDVELVERLPNERTILIATKADLESAWDPAVLAADDRVVLPVSSHAGEGLDALRSRIGEILLGDAASSELWITHERHADVLRRVDTVLERSIGAPDDLMAMDLEEAALELASLTGRGDVAEAVLEHVFANFCVGK